MCTAKREREREWKRDGRCLVHVAETFWRDERRKRPAADAGRLAVHSLSARNSRDRQAATATAAAILRPTHLTHTKIVETKIIQARCLSAHHTRASLRVLTCWDFRTPCVTAYLRPGYPRTALSPVRCAHHSLGARCFCVLFPHVHEAFG